MSKAFVTENPNADDDGPEEPDALPSGFRNCVTPEGLAALQDELRRLMQDERPKIVEIVSWAAGNGDRSENGDYIFNKKKLREIDRRVRYLMKRLDNAELVDPAKQQGLTQVFFGATVTYAKEDGTEHTVRLVGVDEADMEQGKISWVSPVARALMKAKAGDEVELRLPSGREVIEVVSVTY